MKKSLFFCAALAWGLAATGFLAACSSSDSNAVSNDSICAIYGEYNAWMCLDVYYTMGVEEHDFLIGESMERVMERASDSGFLAGMSTAMWNSSWITAMLSEHGVHYSRHGVDSLVLRYVYESPEEQISSPEVYDSLLERYSYGPKDVRKDSLELMNAYAAFHAWCLRCFDLRDPDTRNSVVAGMRFVDSVASTKNDGDFPHLWYAMECISDLIYGSYCLHPQNYEKVIEGYIRVAKNRQKMEDRDLKIFHMNNYFDTLTTKDYVGSTMRWTPGK